MKLLRGFTVHAVDGDGRAFVSRGNSIWEYMPQRDLLRRICSIPFRHFLFNWPIGRTLRRLFRAEMYHVIPTDEESLVVFFDYRVVRVHSGSIETVLSLPVRRPLRVTWVPQKNLLVFGDYSTRRTPHESCIYYSTDGGQHWQKGYCFPPGTIRHIHNVVFDEYRDSFWILTGDYGHEAGIWRTSDFHSVEPLLVGEQQFRAVELVPLPEGILWATDSEKERNQVLYFDLNSQSLTHRQQLPGSAFYTRAMGDHFLVTTVVEPSAINRVATATVWLSRDSQHWHQALAVHRSRLPLRYFGYAEITVPVYRNPETTPYFYLSTRNCWGGDRMWVFPRDQWMEMVNAKGGK